MDPMFTKIVIRHTTVESLKSSQLWSEIMAIAFLDGVDVSVVEIGCEDAPADDDADD